MPRESIIPPNTDPAALLSSYDINRSPEIQRLKTQFLAMLPSNFGNTRVYISPVPSLESVIRADCQNYGCGVRAFIHIKRVAGSWVMIESKPVFDRLQNANCSSCRKMLL